MGEESTNNRRGSRLQLRAHLSQDHGERTVPEAFLRVIVIACSCFNSFSVTRSTNVLCMQIELIVINACMLPFLDVKRCKLALLRAAAVNLFTQREVKQTCKQLGTVTFNFTLSRLLSVSPLVTRCQSKYHRTREASLHGLIENILLETEIDQTQILSTFSWSSKA